jgi:cyclopropane fatty-acyl-phospholipid synthase-like methyltransferase
MAISEANAEQAALWNGKAARGWVDGQEQLDRLYRPFEDLLVEAAAARSPSRLADIGCGTGGTTLAIAGQLAADAR